jgi:DNA helicase HerA-like ATPase
VADVPYTLEKIIATIDEWAFVGKPTSAKGGTSKPAAGADLYSYLALKGKLGGLKRTGAFDTPGVDPIDPARLIQPGRVTVFDVSFANDRLKNLVIAQLLRSVFEYKREHQDSARTMLIIEEAHTFISAEKSGRMQETIELLREIARRGRKRWLGLTFISQQPSHLPNEIFELCNTRLVHNVKSQNNLRVLKTTAGDVADEIWDLVPTLGVGQAICSTPQYRDPVVVNMRPSTTKREFVD